VTTLADVGRVRAVRTMLEPASIAIVGASPGRGDMRALRAALGRAGYAGTVHPVNPKYEEIWGLRAYPSVSAIPDEVDHVFVSVPSAATPGVVADVLRSSAATLTMLSSGFGEGQDEDGRRRAEQLLEMVRTTRPEPLPMSGPNCGGVFRWSSRLNTLNLRRMPEDEGRPVAIVAQSGGVSVFLYEALYDRGVQCRTIVSTGNELDLTTADYIRFFAEDEETRVVACYGEAIRDVRAFADACRYAEERGTSVVMLKLGGSAESQAAAIAHTGSLVGSRDAFEALARRIGVVSVRTVDELVDAVELLSVTGRLESPRPGLLVHSGGLKGLLGDYAADVGLTFPPLAPETVTHLGGMLGVGTSIGNPLDSGAYGLLGPEHLLECVDAMDADPNTDILLLQEELPRTPQSEREESYLRAVQEAKAAGRWRKPVGVFSMVSYSLTDHSRAIRRELPDLFVLQEAHRALSLLARLSDVRDPEPEGQDVPEASAWLRGLLVAPGPSALSEEDSKRVLTEFGVPVSRDVHAADLSECLAAAEAVGYPVVLKLSSPSLVHKSEIGGVAVGIRSDDELRAAFERLRAAGERHLAGQDWGYLVSQQAPRGVEVILGVKRDPEAGLVLAFGGGGVTAELYDDVAVAMVPVGRDEARRLVHRTLAGRLVAGFRGAASGDEESLVEAIVALSGAATALGPRLAAIDVNPCIVSPVGVVAVDASVVLEAGGGEDSR